MATIKAGTYTMKNDISLPASYLDTSSLLGYLTVGGLNTGYSFSVNPTEIKVILFIDDEEISYFVFQNGAWSKDQYRTWVFSEDVNADDEFSTWFNANLDAPYYEITATSAEGVVLHVKDKLIDNDIKVTFPDGGGSGGAELNIAYGETAPEDTSKLWVSGAEPSKVSTAFKVEGEETFTAGVGALPVAAYGIGAAAVGSKVYLFGGRASSGRLKTINAYDTKTKAVTTLSATLPTAAENIAVAAVGSKIYLFGGSSADNAMTGNLNTISVFDTATETISTLSTTLPTATSSMGIAAVGANIYLFGGEQSTNLRTINCFNTETKTITKLDTKLSSPSLGIGCAAVGTKIYLFGGYRENSISAEIDVFDIETNTLTVSSTVLPVARQRMGIAAVGTQIYLCGGQTNTANIYKFDTESESIELLTTMQAAAYNIGAAAVGTKIYLFGGYGSAYIPNINLLSIDFDLPTDNLLLHLSATDNLFKLINADTASIEVGVQGVYRGNADGVGEKETAYLHNGTDWVEV